MAGLKELRTRIETIKSTQKITSAMKMVAASSLRKAQGLIASSVPYRENILSPLENVVSEFRTLEQNGTFVKWPRMIAGSENDRTYLLLVFTSDRGLCGNFNASVAKVAARRIEELQNAGKEVKVAWYRAQRIFYPQTPLCCQHCPRYRRHCQKRCPL